MYHLALRQLLKKDFDVLSAYNTEEAQAIVKNRKIDLLLLDVRINTARDGLDCIPKLKALDEELTIVMLSGLKEFETVREAMRLGATDYLAKDVDADELLHIISRIFERKALIIRQQQLGAESRREAKRFNLVGDAPGMQSLKRLVERARHSMTNVVIHGETGTGKEVIARLLRSENPDGSIAPFVAVDSATIHGNTAESILFGHEKGAFTGADKLKKGIFEEAHGGIIYFDEIANMPLDIQAKLLRVIQEKEVTRLGAARSIPLEFRVICATNKDLLGLVKQGLFKEDLYQRLNVIPIMIPALRERKEDVPLLLNHFSERYSQNNRVLNFTDEVVEFLSAYDWPGNVRELSNLVSYLYAMCESDSIEVADLPPQLRDAIAAPARVQTPDSSTFYERISGFENQILREEYDRCQGNISRLALKLGMDRSHLYTKLRIYGIHGMKKAGGADGSEHDSDSVSASAAIH